MNVYSSQRIWAQCRSHANDAVVLFFDTTPRVGGGCCGRLRWTSGLTPIDPTLDLYAWCSWVCAVPVTAPPPGPLTMATSVSTTMKELSSRMKHVYFILFISKEHCFFKHPASCQHCYSTSSQRTTTYTQSSFLSVIGVEVMWHALHTSWVFAISFNILKNTTVHHITTRIFFLTFISFLSEIFLHVVIVKSQSPPLQ